MRVSEERDRGVQIFANHGGVAGVNNVLVLIGG